MLRFASSHILLQFNTEQSQCAALARHDRPLRNFQCLCGLGLGQPGKVPQHDYLAQFFRQALNGFTERQTVVIFRALFLYRRFLLSGTAPQFR